jgi:hypothetical protein
MSNPSSFTRRDALKSFGAVGALALSGAATAAGAEPAKKTIRVGVISAAIHGKPQDRNGHTWHFAQYLHPDFDLDALKKHTPPKVKIFSEVIRNPKFNFDQLPFPDTRITHYYDRSSRRCRLRRSPGTTRATEPVCADGGGGRCDLDGSDASGYGREDHFDLVAPGLAKGLPTFCDKPIGGTAGTRKILNTHAHGARSCRRAFPARIRWKRRRACATPGSSGQIEHVPARLMSRYRLDGWMIYAHPVWTVMTLMGAGRSQ